MRVPIAHKVKAAQKALMNFTLLSYRIRLIVRPASAVRGSRARYVFDQYDAVMESSKQLSSRFSVPEPHLLVSSKMVED